MRGRPRKSYTDDFAYTSRMAWYVSRGWSANAKAAVKAAGERCQICGEAAERLEAHHIADPFPQRDVELLLRIDNIRVTCALCHRRAHQPGVVTKCETCGTDVRHNPAQKKRRFCSLRCRDQHPDFGRLTERSCRGCRNTFQPKRAEQRCCGATCAAKVAGETKRARQH